MTDYLAELRAQGRSFTCPRCGNTDLRHVLMAEGPHYAKIVCDDHPEAGPEGLHVDWGPKPDSLKKRRASAHKNLSAKLKARGIDYCQLCLRHERDLPAPEVLVGHHVIEYQSGGNADPENAWQLCSACHALVHWRRTYEGHNCGRAAAEAEAPW